MSARARECDSGIGGAGFKDIGVRTGEGVGHHGARGGAHYVDAGRVGEVFGEGVLDHRDDRGGVTAAVMGEGGGVLDVPAPGHVGGVGVDEDEVVGVGVGWEAGGGEEGGAGAAAGVHGDDDGGLGGELVRDVDVHVDFGGVGAEVVDFFELGGAS